METWTDLSPASAHYAISLDPFHTRCRARRRRRGLRLAAVGAVSARTSDSWVAADTQALVRRCLKVSRRVTSVGRPLPTGSKHAEDWHADDPRDRWLSIVEAVVLSLVAVLAAYSGFAAAKWSTMSSVSLARASTLRTTANRADLEALATRTLDSCLVQRLVHRLCGWQRLTRSGSPRGGFAPGTAPRSSHGLPPIPHTTGTLLRVPRICGST